VGQIQKGKAGYLGNGLAVTRDEQITTTDYTCNKIRAVQVTVTNANILRKAFLPFSATLFRAEFLSSKFGNFSGLFQCVATKLVVH
jgi:hypothetical protein